MTGKERKEGEEIFRKEKTMNSNAEKWNEGKNSERKKREKEKKEGFKKERRMNTRNE